MTPAPDNVPGAGYAADSKHHSLPTTGLLGPSANLLTLLVSTFMASCMTDPSSTAPPQCNSSLEALCEERPSMCRDLPEAGEELGACDYVGLCVEYVKWGRAGLHGTERYYDLDTNELVSVLEFSDVPFECGSATRWHGPQITCLPYCLTMVGASYDMCTMSYYAEVPDCP